jgi:hypothetical protein
MRPPPVRWPGHHHDLRVPWRATSLLPWRATSLLAWPFPPARCHSHLANLRAQIKAGGADVAIEDSIMSLYLSAVVGAGYPLSSEDAMDFSTRVGRIVSQSIGVPLDAALAPELEVLHDVVEE